MTGGSGGGRAGIPGAPGSKWRTGSSAPANSLGVDTDQYLNTTTGDVYTRASGAYSVTGNIRGTAGAAAPDPLIVTGLTGGTTGCICYLAAPGVVRDLDRSMLGKLRDNIPRFFKHPNGNYYLLNQGQISGLSGLTSGLVMTLKQKTSNADTNVAYYDQNAVNGYTPYQPTAFQAYLEPGRVLSATTLLANLTLGSIRFGDTSGTPIQTVQDKIATTGTYAYTNNAAIPAGIWNYPWGNFGSTYRFADSSTSYAPNGAVAEFNDSGNTLLCATHVGVTAFADGGVQAVSAKGDGAAQPFWTLNRIAGTSAAPIAVGVQADVANKRFGVGYFNGGAWQDCTDPAAGLQTAATLGGSVGFRTVVDTIGTFVGAKVWPTASAEPPDYTLWGWQNAVTGAGASGVAVSYGRLWVGDFGVYWAAPGSAPRGP